MSDVSFIFRTDDLGSSHSANLAIESVTIAGMFKNVSVMACGPMVEEAAQMLSGRKEICFGMHTTLNAEWDRVKWRPVLPLGKDSGLVDENGYFLADPSMFLETRPSIETIMAEVAAQLERLRALGFDVKYIDSHMFPEMFVEGLDEAMGEFIKERGLVDHMYYYNIPRISATPSESYNPFAGLPAGQYFWVSHPSLDTEEMRMTGNAGVPGSAVAASRAAETELYSSASFTEMMRSAGIRGVRYDEAAYEKRFTLEEIKRMLSAN